VKWYLGASIGLLFSVVSARGDAQGDLIAQGHQAMNAKDYTKAVGFFDQFISAYPTSDNLDQVRLLAGDAALQGGDFPKAVTELSKVVVPFNKPAARGTALYFTALAQFSQAHKLASDPKTEAQAADYYRQAEETLTTLVGFIQTDATPDTKKLLEDVLYYQTLAAFAQKKYAAAETDMNTLLATFPASLQKPDYLLLLGSIYAVQVNSDLTHAGDKKPVDKDKVSNEAQKAISALQQVSGDPNALVQGDQANMQIAEILFLVAQLDLPSTDGYAKALDAFRLVRRKANLVPIQQARLDQLRVRSASDVRSDDSALALKNSRLIDRETSRLNDLQSGPDPIIQALIRMAQCYISMRQPDEARTILHRLGVVKLTDEQQQDVDFQTLYSYTLGGQEDKATAALDAYLAKHPGDPRVDSISVQIGAALMGRGDYAGALAQAQYSLKVFPNGQHVGDAVLLESEALTKLNRLDEAGKVISEFVAKNPTRPEALQLMVTKGEDQLAQGDLNGALKSFQQVKDNNAAGPYQSAAHAFYINTLNRLNRYDDVIAEAKKFTAKYPASPDGAGVALLSALALDKKNDPGAIPALQDMAKNYAANPDLASYALFSVCLIYQREGKIPELTQETAALRAAFPTAYALIGQATDLVAAALLKEKKYDDAIAAYQPLVSVPVPEIAADAQNKIGSAWLQDAASMGTYQSFQTDELRAEAEKRLQGAEQAYLATLKNFPDNETAVGNAFKGLTDVGLQRRSWGLLPNGNMEDYLTKVGAGLTTPALQTRLELAKAGVVFVNKNSRDQYPAALDRFTKALAASPGLVLTAQEADQYGQLLLAAKDYPKALEVYNALLATAKPTDQVKLADGYFGLGATYLAQGDLVNAKANFQKMQGLSGGAAWSEHATEAQIDMAQINEKSSNPTDLNAAEEVYATIMQSQQAGARLQAESMLGFGRILEKTGHAVKAAGQADIDYATHYYEQVNLFYGPATPELSAEGLYLAAQAYAKAGDTVDAAKDYATLRANYATTAPDWVAKIPAQ
jgi:tetratricopeptide (TPR) repeat protein